MTDHHFVLQEHEAERVLMIDVAGHIDGLNVDGFKAELDEKIKAYGGTAVVLDMAKLTYISSAGLRAILVAAKVLHAKGRKFSICSLSEGVNSMVRTAGFDKVIDVYESASDAVSAVNG